MYAIIETGSKQYKVSEGDIIKVEKLNVESGDSYEFKNVLLVADGDNFSFGNPYLENACVSSTVIGNGKHKKVVIYKYKPKKGFHKKKGHRQQFTQLKIEKISL
jgi:ribosomal protein L21